MIIDWLIKKKYYILCTTNKNGITTETIAYWLLNNIWKLYGLLLLLISNQDFQFILRIWKKICKIFGIKINLFALFYLKTDKQSKIANQQIEWHFCLLLTINKMTD